jgi:hypothetical protein
MKVERRGRDCSGKRRLVKRGRRDCNERNMGVIV